MFKKHSRNKERNRNIKRKSDSEIYDIILSFNSKRIKNDTHEVSLSNMETVDNTHEASNIETVDDTHEASNIETVDDTHDYYNVDNDNINENQYHTQVKQMQDELIKEFSEHNSYDICGDLLKIVGLQSRDPEKEMSDDEELIKGYPDVPSVTKGDISRLLQEAFVSNGVTNPDMSDFVKVLALLPLKNTPWDYNEEEEVCYSTISKYLSREVDYLSFDICIDGHVVYEGNTII